MSRLEVHQPLQAGLAAALLAWAFIRISSEMVEGDTRTFDMAMLRAAQSLRVAHPWLADVMRDPSGLGSTTVLTLFTLIAAWYLAVAQARMIAVLVMAAVTTGSLGVTLLKSTFGRPRPDEGFAELFVAGMSFPSGHATLSAIVFLTIAALLASTRTRSDERT
jgi:undecaprenyl-diphosphatase